MKSKWVEPDTRDEIVDFIEKWTVLFKCITTKFIYSNLGIYPSRFYEWKHRYGKQNIHNGCIPRSNWLFQDEKDRIVEFYLDHHKDGYRRCAYMMIDKDVVYCSPSTVYNVLSEYDVLRRWNRNASKKGDGFEQPLEAHEHWHIDISYVNIAGTFYYLITLLDGFSRYIVHWDIRESMKEFDVQLVVQRAKELFPQARPRIISDNGKQFVGRNFKELVRIHGMTHVKTSPYYPQSNGKLERWHKTVKSECIRPGCALTHKDAKRIIKKFVIHYNERRLHSAIGYVAPKDKLEGRSMSIHKERDKKLEEGRLARIKRSKKERKIEVA